MAVVFFKSLIGTILGICFSLWDYFTTSNIVLSIKIGGLDPPSTVLF